MRIPLTCWGLDRCGDRSTFVVALTSQGIACRVLAALRNVARDQLSDAHTLLTGVIVSAQHVIGTACAILNSNATSARIALHALLAGNTCAHALRAHIVAGAEIMIVAGITVVHVDARILHPHLARPVVVEANCRATSISGGDTTFFAVAYLII